MNLLSLINPQPNFFSLSQEKKKKKKNSNEKPEIKIKFLISNV